MKFKRKLEEILDFVFFYINPFHVGTAIISFMALLISVIRLAKVLGQ